MPRRLLKDFTARWQPAVDRITSHPWIRQYLPALADPDLWYINRRSASRAVAIGLFCGLIPGPLQVLSAIIVCLFVRAQFPIAVITTFYTNPFTIVPLYVVAYEYGRLFFPGAPPMPKFDVPLASGMTEWLPALMQWMGQLGKPLALGLPLLAVTLAAIGFVLTRVLWRCHAVWSWRRRARQRRMA